MKPIGAIVRLLKHVYPSSFFARSSDPFYILISTVLSQRTRDENTDRAAKELFRHYKTPRQLASAPVKRVEKLIRPSGFYKVKAQRIRQISQELLDRYNGSVPKDMDELLSLHGVGRKTAGCVLVYAFRIPAIPVDTHVHRISNLIGLVNTKTPEQSELALMDVVPKRYWIDLNELLVKHGQNICLPRRPKCADCPISSHCDYGTRVLRL
jgi:endonuclease-3